MAEKRDWLSECNNHGVPLEDFRLQFCVRCLQPECTRSQHGKSQFEARVSDWEERLFCNVPRMDVSDPRFELIRAKRFLTLDTSRPHEVQGWVDPRNLDEGPSSPLNKVPEAKPADIGEQAPVKALPHEEATVRQVPVFPSQTAPMNTPNRPQQMIGAKKVNEQPPVLVSDPWTKPQPRISDGTKVVRAGAKIRLGGDSGV